MPVALLALGATVLIGIFLALFALITLLGVVASGFDNGWQELWVEPPAAFLVSILVGCAWLPCASFVLGLAWDGPSERILRL